MPPFGQMLAGGRVGLGVLTLVAPEIAAKSFGLNIPANPQSGIWARMFATREIMLGSAVLVRRPGGQGFAIKAGIGVDAGDALGACSRTQAGRRRLQGVATAPWRWAPSASAPWPARDAVADRGAMALPLAVPTLPQLAKSAKTLPTGDGWVYEPKFDGFRALAFVDGDAVELQSRNGKTLTRYFPELRVPGRPLRHRRRDRGRRA